MMDKRNVNSIAYGKEPIPPKNQVFMDAREYNLFLHDAFNWYNNIIKDIEKKKWVVKWGVDHGYNGEVLKSIPESYLSTIGSMVRIQENGFKFNQKHLNKLDDMFKSLVNKFKSTPKKKVIKRGGVDNVALVMTDFDNALDALFEKKNIEISINHPLSAPNINELKTYYNKQIDYIEEDKENHLYKRLLNKHKEIINILQKSVKVVVRKQRVKKPVSKSKQVAKLNYMKTLFNVKSINPIKIIGASKLVVFNTNNRKITIFYADDESGFQVKGSTLLNYSAKSGSKTIRKPEMKLVEFVSAPKVRTDKIFAEINAVKGKVTGRINKHCLLVKVF